MYDKIYNFLELWKELKNNDIEIVFEDGSTFSINNDIELIWNIDNTSISFNLPN